MKLCYKPMVSCGEQCPLGPFTIWSIPRIEKGEWFQPLPVHQAHVKFSILSTSLFFPSSALWGEILTVSQSDVSKDEKRRGLSGTGFVWIHRSGRPAWHSCTDGEGFLGLVDSVWQTDSPDQFKNPFIISVPGSVQVDLGSHAVCLKRFFDLWV